MDHSSLVTLTADIVAAHVANNRVPPNDMPNLVRQVHGALAALVAAPQAQEAEQKKSPIVSVRASIKPDYLVCMECGKRQKTLRRHLMTAHGMTPDQYRKDYGLPDSYPLTAPNYSDRRREMAKAIGLGRKKGEKAPAPKSGGSGGRGRKRQRAANEG
ncbi:MAG: MucR family transcriptional regulator [Pseudomonadota bacterium]|nr:MucR family transcriptional regulator [Pseudomonadota bacterium]